MCYFSRGFCGWISSYFNHLKGRTILGGRFSSLNFLWKTRNKCSLFGFAWFDFRIQYTEQGFRSTNKNGWVLWGRTRMQRYPRATTISQAYMKPNLGHAHLFIKLKESDGMRVVDFTEQCLPQWTHRRLPILILGAFFCFWARSNGQGSQASWIKICDRSGSTPQSTRKCKKAQRQQNGWIFGRFFLGFCPVKFWLAHWNPLPEAEIVHSKLQSLTDRAEQTLQNSLDIEHGICALWRRCRCSVIHNKFERLFGQSPVGIWKASCSEFWLWMLFAAHSIIIGFRNQHQQHSALQWAGAPEIWKRFNTGELRTCCAK